MKRASTTSTSGERLQKILSQAGISSRRAAEELIRAGRVTAERADGEGAGDEGGPADGPDHR